MICIKVGVQGLHVFSYERCYCCEVNAFYRTKEILYIISIPFCGSSLSEVLSIFRPNFRLCYSRLHQGLRAWGIHACSWALSKIRSQSIFFQKLVPNSFKNSSPLHNYSNFSLFSMVSPFYLKLFFFFRIFCGFSKNRFFFLVFLRGF